MKWFLYILKCKDGSFYTGITTNITRRVIEHNLGIGAKSLLGKRPVELVYSEAYNSQAEARRREEAIKSWKREYKVKLILNRRGNPK